MSNYKFIQVNLQHAFSANCLLSKKFSDGGYDFGLIQEPHQVHNQIKNISSGELIYKSDGNRFPRAALIIRRGLKVTTLTQFISEDLAAAAVDIEKDGFTHKLVICSSYHCRESSIVTENFEKLVDFCKGNNRQLIIGCDANAHNFLWGSNTSDNRGDLLTEYLFIQDLAVLNEGSKPTYNTIKVFNGVPTPIQSIIDLTISTSFIANSICNWQVLDDITASDHKYITFELEASHDKVFKYRDPKKTNWQVFNDTVEIKIGILNMNIETVHDIDSIVEKLNKLLLDTYYACNKECVKESNFDNKWYNNDLKQMKIDLRRLERKANETNDWSNYHQYLNQYTVACKKAKQFSWKKTTEELNNIAATSRLHKLLSKGHNNKIGTFKTDYGYTTNEKESLEALANVHFPGSSVSTDNSLEPDFTYPTDTNDTSKNIFTNEIISWAIDSFSSFKAAGPDKIFPALLQNSKKHIVPVLRNIFIRCHSWGYIPKQWRKVNVVYIPKAGKRPSDDPKSLRPISLTSFVQKTMERVIDRYLRDKILKTFPLHHRQFAYQPGKSTVSALQTLSNEIKKTMNQKQYALGAFLDISGAFDNTSVESIRSALIDRGIDTQTCRWITAMLSNRKVISELGNETLSVDVHKGCPQGGVLSPLLWTLVVDSLLKELNDNCFFVQGYADDIVILVKGSFTNIISERMQNALNVVENWCTEHGLMVNPDKTEIVNFTKNYGLNGPLHVLKLFGKNLTPGTEVKYLGVILDKRLTFNKHLDKVIQKAKSALFTCKKLAGKNWGVKPKIAHWIYTAIIRPIVTYASIVWWERTTIKYIITKLNSLQRLACLMITGASRSTPTASLEVLLDLPPLHLFVKHEAALTNYNFIISNFREIKRLADNKLSFSECIPLSDHTIMQYNFNQNYSIEFPDRNDIIDNLNFDDEEEMWFTDGSKTDNKTGFGIYGYSTNERISVSTGVSMTVFQTEILAIKTCTEHLLEKSDHGKSLTIYSDSQAALKALNNFSTRSKLVHETKDKLNALGAQNNLSLSWVPAHCGIEGNEVADKLAKEGANRDFIGPEPYVGVSRSEIKTKMKRRLITTWNQFWSRIEGLRHSKNFIRGLDSNRSHKILNYPKKHIRLIVGFLTGHYPLKARLKLMHLATDDECRWCLEERETAEHLLRECEALAYRRRIYLGQPFLKVEDFHNIGVEAVFRFLSRLKL
jgi:ribonuclease HI